MAATQQQRNGAFDVSDTEFKSLPGWQLSQQTMPAAIRALESCGDQLQLRMNQYRGTGMHIQVAGWEDDMRKATDLLVVTFRAMRLGVRVREYKNLEKYSGSFTIRTHSRTGNPNSEALKFRQGCGDFLLYAWATPDNTALEAGAVIDLHVWRKHEQNVPHGERDNGRKSGGHDLSAFNYYSFADFPDELLVYRWDDRQGLW